MKKTILFIASVLLLTSCNKLSQAKMFAETMDSLLNTTDSLSGNNDYEAEEGEADDTETMGLALYEAEAIDISELPKTAEEQDRQGRLVLYVNVEQEPTEDESTGIYSVWMADEKAGKACKILTTNPTAGGLWDEMEDKNAAPTEMHLIAAAERAFFASKDGKKVIVQGCPDGRNYWTYIIDTEKRTAKQYPSTEGVQSIDLDKGEVILASYGYYPAPDYGRYTVNNAYTIDGKFLRQVGEPETE